MIDPLWMFRALLLDILGTILAAVRALLLSLADLVPEVPAEN
jgi:hypothetical protein